MEKCLMRALRHECIGKMWYDCQLSDYVCYVVDDKAIADGASV